MDRVKWFRDRAARDRVQEEKEILEAEFQCTTLSFTKMSDVWTKLAAENATSLSRAGYVHKQAAGCIGPRACGCQWQGIVCQG